MKTLTLLALGLFLMPQAPPTILRFAWPEGTVAVVETDFVRQGGPDTDAAISHLRMTHRMQVLADPDGRRIRFDRQTAVESAGDFASAASALLPLWTPDTIVNERGGFVRIEGSERLLDLFEAASGRFKELAEDVPAVREYLTIMTKGNGLAIFQSQEWRTLVWQWIGMSTDRRRTESIGSLGVMPDMAVPTKVVTDVVDRGQCARGGEPYDCVTFETRTSIDRDSLMKAAERLAAGAGGRPPIQLLDYEGVVRVTLETATMLPHRFLQTRTMHSLETLNGSALPSTDFENRQVQFTYQPATAITP